MEKEIGDVEYFSKSSDKKFFRTHLPFKIVSKEGFESLSKTAEIFLNMRSNKNNEFFV